MRYENWISYRYMIATKGRFLTFLNIISICGVAIGVMSLIVVLGVMTGFGNNLREKLVGTTPHLMIEQEAGINDVKKVFDRLKLIKGIKGMSPYIHGNIFLEQSGRSMGLAVRGVNPLTEGKITKVDEYLKKGTLKDLGEGKVFIGSELARFYGYEMGDTVTLISPGSGLAGQNWRYTLEVAGIFNTGMADIDMNLLLVNLRQAQTIFNLPAGFATGIGVQVVDPYKAEQIQQEIYQRIGYEYSVTSWIDSNRNLFEALFLEKWGLFIILILMVLVAAFNIVSTLVVTVSTKVHDIGILQSIGATKSSIRKIFTKQGTYIGALGTLWGVAGGVVLTYILRHFIKVPQEIYSIDHVPVELQLTDMLVIIVSAMTISFLATIYPAAQAAALQPVEALRYE